MKELLFKSSVISWPKETTHLFTVGNSGNYYGYDRNEGYGNIEPNYIWYSNSLGILYGIQWFNTRDPSATNIQFRTDSRVNTPMFVIRLDTYIGIRSYYPTDTSGAMRSLNEPLISSADLNKTVPFYISDIEPSFEYKEISD